VTADLLHNSIPVFAPLAALLTVQVTVWGSVSRGLQRVLGVVAGVLVAYGFARVAGINAWSVGLVVLVGLLAGQALRLGPQGSVQVPVSALLVLVLGATTGGYALDRVVDTAIGAGAGILVNFVFVPRSRLPQACAEVAGVARDVAALLGEMGRALGAGKIDARSRDYLQHARDLSGRARHASSLVGDAETATRWNPGARHDRPAAELLADAAGRITLVERPVRGIARALADAPEGWTVPIPLARSLSELLARVSADVSTWAGGLDDVVAEVRAAHGASAGLGSEDNNTFEDAVPDGSGAAGQPPGAVAAFRSVLVAARNLGVDAETAAVASSIALDAKRVSEEFSYPLRAKPAGGRWRQLFG
jgi:uncharacterized membrane protein YccC